MEPVEGGSFKLLEGRRAVIQKIAATVEHYAGLGSDEGFENFYYLGSQVTPEELEERGFDWLDHEALSFTETGEFTAEVRRSSTSGRK